MIFIADNVNLGFGHYATQFLLLWGPNLVDCFIAAHSYQMPKFQSTIESACSCETFCALWNQKYNCVVHWNSLGILATCLNYMYAHPSITWLLPNFWHV